MLYRNANGIPREIVMHVAQRLSRRGIKQQEIAQMLACSQSTVSTWLKSLNQPPEYLDQEAVEDIVHSLMESRP
ncbi:helix-turn-helix domain-containing protein [Yersinia enterocolitica]|nr:hypothetical protein [Yersinia enterocolitica]ELX2272478.1 helix-turn-helix domain-containing protein [Yersinia enterocolitica]HEN3475890.1 helix-turn-helix domain-containing protein [Yersinia enterocolitica]